MRTCTQDNCDRPHRARGLCASHYNQTHAPNRHAPKPVACTWCGTEVMKNSGGSKARRPVCSNECRQWLTTPYCVLPADHWARWYGKSSTWPRAFVMSEAGRQRHLDWTERSRSPLAVAVRDGQHSEVLRLILKDCVVTDANCWEWQRKTSSGYAEIRLNIDGKPVHAQVHRLSLEAKYGKPLGKQAAHHMCANTKCVNPDHLQPITHRENIAEMMERNYYLARIAELEAALATAAPGHPLLTHIGTPSAA